MKSRLKEQYIQIHSFGVLNCSETKRGKEKNTK